MKPSASHPPLRVWGYTAGILAVVLAFLACEERIPAFARLTSAASADALHLERLDDAGANALHVVALGSSKTVYAIDYDSRFARRIAASSRPVVFHRVTWEGANFLDLEVALRALAEHPPDVLLLESDLLLFVRGGRFPIRRNLMPLEQRFHAHLYGDGDEDENYRQNRGAERFTGAQECADRSSEREKRIYAKRLAAARLSTPASRETYLGLLRALQGSGTRIVLMRLPRSSWAQAMVPPKIAAIDSVTLPALAKAQGFGLWAPAALPADAFCDEGHLTVTGRALYSSWLASQLSAMESAGNG